MKKRILPSVLALALITPAALAQTPCHAENDGNIYLDNVSMGGPNLILAVQFVAPSALAVSSIEVFTGEGSGTNTVGIWSHDPSTGYPDTDLGTGSWSMSNANDWQGASLPATVSLTSGTVYWMTWGCQNSSQAAVQDGGTVLGQPYSGSFNGGASWSGPFQFTDRHWKFRLYCGSGPGIQYCSGDGIAPHTPCPCNNTNNGAMGGCDWGGLAFPEGGVLEATGSSSMAAADTYLVAAGIENNFGIFFGAANQVNGGNGNPLNDGLRCAGGSLVRLTPPTTAAGNQATTPLPVQVLDTGAASGVTRRYQYWFRTPTGPCGQMANLTNGYEIVWGT